MLLPNMLQHDRFARSPNHMQLRSRLPSGTISKEYRTMTSDVLTFHRIAALDGGIWKNFKCSKGSVLHKNCLIYGPNGSGKTTLSRMFSSIQRQELEEGLPSNTNFKVVLSNGSEVTQALSSKPFGNNLLVYNSDFIRRNIRWDDCNADGIAYLSEEKIEIKDQFEENEANISELSDQLDVLATENGKADKDIKGFTSGLAKEIREIPGVEMYTQRYDAKKIISAYQSDTYGSDFQLNEDERSYAIREVGQGKSFGHIEVSKTIPDQVWEWFDSGVSMVSESFERSFIKDLENHSEALTRLGWLVEYHDSNRLDDCLLCGNPFSEDRRRILREWFNESWRSLLDRYIVHRNVGAQYEENINQVLPSIPQTGVIIEAKREEYDIAMHEYISIVKDITLRVKMLIEQLEVRAENPVKDIIVAQTLNDSSLLELKQRYINCQKTITAFIEAHNNAVERRDENMKAAFERLEKHKLAENQVRWKSLTDEKKLVEEKSASAREKLSKLVLRREELKSKLFNHGKGADLLNRTIHDYLGHDEIKLVAEEGGYKLQRSGGEDARELSEGEKSAIAFSYFLTLLEGEGRNLKDLVVVIDDPVSSLDSVARTQAFSLIIRKTKKCAQTIVLTHSIEFMNMIKRRFQSQYTQECEEPEATLLHLSYRDTESGATRSVDLQNMHPLLVDYESEYHYLFSIIYEVQHSSENIDLFKLPNVTRKLLEMFTSVCSPDKVTFAEALMDHQEKVKDRVDIRALERLVQIESHGKMEGLSSFPVLTLEHARAAAIQALEFMKVVSNDHYKRMVRMYKRHKKKEREKEEGKTALDDA